MIEIAVDCDFKTKFKLLNLVEIIQVIEAKLKHF